MVEVASRNWHVDQTMASEMLAHFVGEQKAGSQVEVVAVDSRKHLLGDFKGTAVFRRRYLQLFNRMVVPRDEDELAQISDDFAGMVFQDMAFMFFMFISQTKPESLTLVSPERTRALYRKLFPRATLAHYPFRDDSLSKVNVPDGILVREDGSVAAICEYSLNGGHDYFQNKVEGFNRQNEVFGKILNGAKLIVVTPTFREHKPSGLEVVELPFNHHQFRDFTEYTFENYRMHPESATIMEVQKRAKEQLARARLFSMGSATLETRRYLERFARVA